MLGTAGPTVPHQNIVDAGIIHKKSNGIQTANGSTGFWSANGRSELSKSSETKEILQSDFSTPGR